MCFENGKSSEIAKTSEKKKQKWGRKSFEVLGNLALDYLKYPFAILLFNLSMFMIIKMKMVNGNVEIVLKETDPTFY